MSSRTRRAVATVTVYRRRRKRSRAAGTTLWTHRASSSSASAASPGRSRSAARGSSVARGRAAGYAVVIDNITGDSSLFTFEDLPGGIQDVLDQWRRAGERAGTGLLPDGRPPLRPDGHRRDRQWSLSTRRHANPSPADGSLRPSRRQDPRRRRRPRSLLALPIGSAGALRFQSDWPVAILCRTSRTSMRSGANPGGYVRVAAEGRCLFSRFSTRRTRARSSRGYGRTWGSGRTSASPRVRTGVLRRLR